ncbi:MAG: hypothetical protein EHM89_07755 [Acidobacteria bacterium]|nr:MAG: hypothetical protein EHM89_07755 [Acidobacteriota bacterium]
MILLALALASFGVASADEEDNAQSHVYVVVDPNITILPGAASVNLGTVQTGIFPGRIQFRIDANTEQVQFYAVVSHLYKGDVCTITDVPPIPVALPPGVVMTADAANPVGGSSNVADYTGTAIQNTCFDSHSSRTIRWESAQNGHFSQYVYLTPSWIQADPEKPMGEYSGFVSLWAMVVL